MGLPRRIQSGQHLDSNVVESVLDYSVPREEQLSAFSGWEYDVSQKLQHSRSNHKRHCRQHQQFPYLIVPLPVGDGNRDRWYEKQEPNKKENKKCS